MAKRIIWTETARETRRRILEFWIKNNKSKVYSKKLSIEFRERVKYISKYNYLGKQTDKKDVRVTILGHFSLFYKISTTRIMIVGLWDNRRNPDDLIKNLEIEIE